MSLRKNSNLRNLFLGLKLNDIRAIRSFSGKGQYLETDCSGLFEIFEDVAI